MHLIFSFPISCVFLTLILCRAFGSWQIGSSRYGSSSYGSSSALGAALGERGTELPEFPGGPKLLVRCPGFASHKLKPKKDSSPQGGLAVLPGEVLLARSFVLQEEKELLLLPGCVLVLGKGNRWVGNSDVRREFCRRYGKSLAMS